MKHFVSLTLLLVGLVSFGHSAWLFNGKNHLSPVILVPGYGGSRLEAKLNKTHSPRFCYTESDWYTLWLNVVSLLPFFFINCLVDNMKLLYDPKTHTTHNPPGVDIHVTGWGDPEVVEWINPHHHMPGAAYFKDIAEMLVNMGYERKKNLHGAPYDFRKGPSEQRQFFMDLKKLVEDTYEMNARTPVTFITHSMGSPMTLVFLQQQSTEWKQKYIKRQISLAGAWAGSIKAAKVFAMGDDLGEFFIKSAVLKKEQITFPATAWLLPSPLFWPPSDVLVETPSRVYTMAQLQDFFDDIDYRTGWQMRMDNLPFTLNVSVPNVELHCLYGGGVPTVERLRYKKHVSADETPKLIMGKGDGTVNERSLRACHAWLGQQSANITNTVLNGVDHLGILAKRDVLNYIKNVLQP